MNILIIGDVVSQYGCDFIRKKLPKIKKDYNIDLVIANGENASVGNGILPFSANHLFDSGVNIITSGNHIFKRREIYPFLDSNNFIIRPANYPNSCPGKGFCTFDLGHTSITVINLIGVVFMEPLQSPFKTIDIILKNINSKNIIIDFHAEATSEKLALAHYVDGRVTAIFGTHTHVQTADEKILPKGTAYISDVGMVGAKFSILGVKPKCVIQRMTKCMPVRFEISEDDYMLNSILLNIDTNTGKALSIERLNFN